MMRSMISSFGELLSIRPGKLSVSGMRIAITSANAHLSPDHHIKNCR